MNKLNRINNVLDDALRHFAVRIEYSPYELDMGEGNAKLLQSSLFALYHAVPSDQVFEFMASSFVRLAMRAMFDVSIDYAVQVDRSFIRLRDTDQTNRGIDFDYGEVLMRDREDWHTYFMNMARRASERTTCKSGRKVGAVFVREKIPLMSAFNGVPSGYPHPTVCPRVQMKLRSGEGLDMCPCQHAERNAIDFAARFGIELEGSTLYVTSRPCQSCMGSLSGVRVARVIYDIDYPHEAATDIASHGKIELVSFEEVLHEQGQSS